MEATKRDRWLQARDFRARHDDDDDDDDDDDEDDNVMLCGKQKSELSGPKLGLIMSCFIKRSQGPGTLCLYLVRPQLEVKPRDNPVGFSGPVHEENNNK